ncbi:hypothetical protein HWI79_804 [Cryptosporidium felis]|nr:hypothetical protein HWI79_804 [Cryptosporidium felis]
MLEVNSSCLLNGASGDDKELLGLREKLRQVNEDNATSLESIDSLYLTYSSLLSCRKEMELSLSYGLLSDKIVEISKIMCDMPLSVSRYLGLTLILSIWILKSEDWYNLDDVSGTEICNIIIRLVIDSCGNQQMDFFTHAQDQLEDQLDTEESWISEWYGIADPYQHEQPDPDKTPNFAPQVYDFGKLNESKKLRKPKIEQETKAKRKKLDFIFESEHERELRYIIFEMTKRNMETISSLFDKEFTGQLFNTLENLNLQQNNLLNKILFLNSVICLYRCSGSFLFGALIFKLPRGKYLLESGFEIISSHFLKNMTLTYRGWSSKGTGLDDEYVVRAVDDISTVLWFKTLETKLSVILEKAVEEVTGESIEEQQVNREYQRLELLSTHSDLINEILTGFIDSLVDEPHLPDFFSMLRRKLVKTILEAICTSFTIPYAHRNHFMAHFQANLFANHQLLDLFFNIGVLTQISTQNLTLSQEMDLQIFKTYLNTIYLISRFGDSSTKEFLIAELATGLGSTPTGFDEISYNVKSFLYSNIHPTSLERTSNYLPYFLFKSVHFMLANIKEAIVRESSSELTESEDSIHFPEIAKGKHSISSNSSNGKVLYYKVASFVYTLNFIKILFSGYSKEVNSLKKNISNFIESVIIKALSETELKKIIKIINREFNLSELERQILDRNFGFEFEFVTNYLSKLVSNDPVSPL